MGFGAAIGVGSVANFNRFALAAASMSSSSFDSCMTAADPLFLSFGFIFFVITSDSLSLLGVVLGAVAGNVSERGADAGCVSANTEKVSGGVLSG